MVIDEESIGTRACPKMTEKCPIENKVILEQVSWSNYQKPSVYTYLHARHIPVAAVIVRPLSGIVDMDILQAELSEAKDKIPAIEGYTLVACVPAQVRASYKKTDYKQLNVILQFPSTYPQEPIVTELTSKTLSEKLLNGLIKLCDEEAKTHVGQGQIMHIINFVRNFVLQNPLCVCNDEIAAIKKDLLTDGDKLKLKPDTGEVLLKITQGQYVMNLKMSVPDVYPVQPIKIDAVENNFPDLLKVFFVGQAVEVARTCVQPPLKPPKDFVFKPQPSLREVCKFLIQDCVKRYPLEKCPICKNKAMLADPKDVVKDPKLRIERVYCGHLFHHGCLGKYMRTPPFKGGKLCPSCGKQIFHDKWKISPALAEARWAHKQARQRELDEVADFMS